MDVFIQVIVSSDEFKTVGACCMRGRGVGVVLIFRAANILITKAWSMQT